MTRNMRGIVWALILACGLLCMPASPVASQGTAQNGPGQRPAQGVPLTWQALCSPAGRVSRLAADRAAGYLYAVSIATVHRGPDYTQWRSAGKVYRSDALYGSRDGGITWVPLTNDLPPGPITALFADPFTGDLYVGLQPAEALALRGSVLWRSRDRGITWEGVLLDREGLTVRQVARSADGRHLFVSAIPASGERIGYLYRSSDEGRTWFSFRAPGDAASAPTALAELLPNPANAERLLGLAEEGSVYLSDDAGATWKLARPAELSLPVGQAGPARLAISPDRPNTVLLAHAGGEPSRPGLRLDRSTDSGATWTPVQASGLPAEGAVTALIALPGNVYLLSLSTGTFRSADGGTTWQRLEGPLSAGGVSEFLSVADVRPVAGASATPGPAARSESALAVWAATGYGVFISRDAGALWQPSGTGLPCNSSITGLLTDSRQPERVLAITEGRAPGDLTGPPPVLRSADGGRTWSPAARGLPDDVFLAWTQDPNDVNIVFLVGAQHIMRTTDAGLSWQVSRRPQSTAGAAAVAPSDPKVVYVGGRPALRSTDGGATWQEMAVLVPGQGQPTGEVTGLAVDPADPRRLWAALDGYGVVGSTDGGASWRPSGLSGRRLGWLASGPAGGEGSALQGRLMLYAGVPGDGIYRWDAQGDTWVPASAGLPAGSTVLSFVADARTPGTLWAGRDGGGVYRSADYGTTWANVAADVGDNLAQALAPYHGTPGGLLMGTANAGVWALRPAGPVSSRPTAPAGEAAAARSETVMARVDARIEVVWPHGSAPTAEARLANIGLRLFQEESLSPPPCGWTPKVTVWQAVDTGPAEPLGTAVQRTVDGRPFPYWELNDVDVSRANDPARKLYFMVRVAGAETATSVWAHGADPRTFFPSQDVPSGLAAGPLEAVDARIQVVWPHDESGAPRPVNEATLANVAVALFKHGTRLSVPADWQPEGIKLFGAWDHEVGRLLAGEATVSLRRAGAITYPLWEFNNIPVARARSAGATLYLWVMVDGLATHPTIWAHGADVRTVFPSQDEPIQGCMP